MQSVIRYQNIGTVGTRCDAFLSEPCPRFCCLSAHTPGNESSHCLRSDCLGDRESFWRVSCRASSVTSRAAVSWMLSLVRASEPPLHPYRHSDGQSDITGVGETTAPAANTVRASAPSEHWLTLSELMKTERMAPPDANRNGQIPTLPNDSGNAQGFTAVRGEFAFTRFESVRKH